MIKSLGSLIYALTPWSVAKERDHWMRIALAETAKNDELRIKIRGYHSALTTLEGNYRNLLEQIATKARVGVAKEE